MSKLVAYGVCRDCPSVGGSAPDGSGTPSAGPMAVHALFPGERCAAGHLMLAWECIDEVAEDEFVTAILDADLGLSFYSHDQGLIDRIGADHSTWGSWVHTYFAVKAEVSAAARERIGVEETPEPVDLAEAS